MHIQTHIMSGWCIGNLFDLSPRERFCCMVAASVHDLDGLGVIVSEDVYWDYHHLLGHNFAFGLILCAVLVCFSRHQVKALVLYLALFHLHLVMDYFGSGPGWSLGYAWPFSDEGLMSRHAWEFYSWQNITTGCAFVVWMLGIVLWQKRTFLELPMPSLDRQLVALGQRLVNRGNRQGG